MVGHFKGEKTPKLLFPSINTEQLFNKMWYIHDRNSKKTTNIRDFLHLKKEIQDKHHT